MVKIFVGYSQHRDTVFVVFGILCLILWFIFNLYALRDYFCPVFYFNNEGTQRKLDECRKNVQIASTMPPSSCRSSIQPTNFTIELDPLPVQR
ncbi:hypothetical protein DICVIV_12792 [Dictyocaulus viviparus]|uniref:Uncharacterized protein n=1 Tax=Dictyocaulus viviparus TaxID=29172 RepID=A0A0D8X9J8_DICVI|nr:hypothetical protein DICVIV_12792 [Dictyocaulus viviparus]